jgi:hypothetical protein
VYKSYPQGQPELTTVRIVIPADSSLPWHTHDMPKAAYLLSGQLTVGPRPITPAKHSRNRSEVSIAALRVASPRS